MNNRSKGGGRSQRCRLKVTGAEGGGLPLELSEEKLIKCSFISQPKSPLPREIKCNTVMVRVVPDWGYRGQQVGECENDLLVDQLQKFSSVGRGKFSGVRQCLMENPHLNVSKVPLVKWLRVSNSSSSDNLKKK